MIGTSYVAILKLNRQNLTRIAEQFPEGELEKLNLERHSRHLVFVEQVTDDDHVILRNSWGDLMAKIRLHKDDPIIGAYYSVKLKKVVCRASTDRDQDPELFDEENPEQA